MSKEELFWIFSFFFISMIVFTIMINTILLRFVTTLGIRDKETTLIRWSAASKPSLGGISFFIVFFMSLSAYSIFFDSSHVMRNISAFGLIFTSGLGFLMGLADDAYNTKPILKFSIQILCGVVMILTDNYIQITPYEWMNYTLTVLWVVGLMNSINMLDNMDAITTVVSVFIILMMLCVLAIRQNYDGFEFFVLLGMGAALIGFLFHNWHPSKMFMGDTGSQFLGVFLAWFSIKLLWNSQDYYGLPIQFKQFSCVLIAFALPIIDTSIVSINRIRRGQSPFVGGKDHITHHLSYIGLSDSQVAMVFIGLSSISLFLIIAVLRFVENWEVLYTILSAGYFVILFACFFILTQVSGKKDEKPKN